MNFASRDAFPARGGVGEDGGRFPPGGGRELVPGPTGPGTRARAPEVERPPPPATPRLPRASPPHGHAGGELAGLGIRNQHLVIKGVFHAGNRSDPIALALARRADQAGSRPPVRLKRLPPTFIPVPPLRPVVHAGVRRARAGVPDTGHAGGGGEWGPGGTGERDGTVRRGWISSWRSSGSEGAWTVGKVS